MPVLTNAFRAIQPLPAIWFAIQFRYRIPIIVDCPLPRPLRNALQHNQGKKIFRSPLACVRILPGMPRQFPPLTCRRFDPGNDPVRATTPEMSGTFLGQFSFPRMPRPPSDKGARFIQWWLFRIRNTRDTLVRFIAKLLPVQRVDCPWQGRLLQIGTNSIEICSFEKISYFQRVDEVQRIGAAARNARPCRERRL